MAATSSAVARPADPASFEAPVLDGVTAGLRSSEATPPDLVPYVFQGSQDWPALRYRAAQPLDWSDAAALVIPIDNPGAAPFALLIRLDDRSDANGDDRSLTGIVTVPAQSRAEVVLPLVAGPSGMRGRPPSGLRPRPGDSLIPDVRGAVDLRHIVALHISGVRAAGDRTLLIGPPMLRDADSPGRPAQGPIADAFGQALAGDWPEKVVDEADLRRKLADAALATRRLAKAVPRSADRWGGIAGPVFPATGAFQVKKAHGRWMLVTPAGRPFFSLGVDAVQSTNPTIVTGREGLFTDLPHPGSPLAGFLSRADGRQVLDVGQANLLRGLGADWATRWPAGTLARLRAWGFNTLGTWSDPALAPSLPHVAFTDVEGDSAMVPMGGRALVDPFDPRFVAVADAVAATMAESHWGDAGLIGYFSGNELPWGEAGRPAEGIAAHVLAMPPNSPARRILVGDLQARYGTPAAFAAAWGLGALRSWDAAVTIPPAPSPSALQDIARFEGRFADRYFSIVAAALKRHDPAHLYLGTRFAAATPAVVEACARFCDVLSFNVYGSTPGDRASLWRGLDRPVLIGEFHFGSLDRGSFWPGMTAVPTEADRGPAYAAYLRAAVDDPAVVGVHWYQYADEPLTGRPYDGENGHIGLVAVTDIPYAGFVAAVAAANREAQETFGRQMGSKTP